MRGPPERRSASSPMGAKRGAVRRRLPLRGLGRTESDRTGSRGPLRPGPDPSGPARAEPKASPRVDSPGGSPARRLPGPEVGFEALMSGLSALQPARSSHRSPARNARRAWDARRRGRRSGGSSSTARTWRRTSARHGRTRRVAAGSATISTSETMQSVASRSRSGSQRSGRAVAIRTRASWALPMTFSLRSPSSANSTCSRSASSSLQRASRLVVPPGSASGNSARWTLDRGPSGRRPELPQLLGRVRDDRGEQPGQGVVQPGQDELRGAAVGAVGRLGVEPVLEDVEIKARQLHRAELVDPLIDPVELELLVGRADVADHPVELPEGPAVDLVQGRRVDRLRGRTARNPRGSPAGSGTCCGSCDTPRTSP